MLAPAAIMAINGDVSESAVAMIKRQLMIDFTFDGYVWARALQIDPQYPKTLKALNLRVLVIEPTFEFRATDPTWSSFDIVAFVKNGLINIEQNLFGPPIPQLSIEGLTWGKMGIFFPRYH